MTGCRSAAKLAMGVMQQFTSSRLGDTIQECKNLLEQHHQKIKDVFEDSRLSALQVEGEQILIRLQEDQATLPSVPDYMETVNCVTKLYHQMNEVFCKLEMLTENRTRKLEQCLALKEFENDIGEVKQQFHVGVFGYFVFNLFLQGTLWTSIVVKFTRRFSDCY